MNVNTRKALVASVGIVCLTILLLAGKMDQQTGSVGIVGIVMYIIGNGVAAATGKQVDPVVFRRRTERSRVDDE